MVYGAASCLAAPIPEAFEKAQPEVLCRVKETIAKNITHRMFTRTTGIPVEVYGAWEVTYEWLKKRSPHDPDAKRVLDAIRNEVESENIKVEKIDMIPGNSFNFQSPKAVMTLRIGARVSYIRYFVALNMMDKPQLYVSGLDEIDSSPLPLSMRNIKPLPYRNADISAIRRLDEEYHSAGVPEKGEFESEQEYQAQIRNNIIKAYKKFKSSKIADNVYQYDYSLPAKEALQFKMNSSRPQYSSVLYDSLYYALQTLEKKVPYLSTNGTEIQEADIDVAGILKTHAAQAFGTSFYCTVLEAKMIKKNLGDSWEYSKVRLWLKFNLNKMKWQIIKIFILPDK